MGRNKKNRCCRHLKTGKIYKPVAIPLTDIDIIEINLDEFEAIRLCDHEGRSQISAADKMSISRGTIQRLLESGRYKIINAILNNNALKINNFYKE